MFTPSENAEFAYEPNVFWPEDLLHLDEEDDA
jgi:hypothetical protein